jgi:hypothetical protein
VLVQPDDRAVAEHVSGVVKVGVGVFIENRLGIEQRLVPEALTRQRDRMVIDQADAESGRPRYSSTSRSVVPSPEAAIWRVRLGR